MINTLEMEEYLRSLLPPCSQLLQELEQEAQEEQIPIFQPEVAKLMETLIAIHKPKEILEIGTAIGYSTIRLAQAVKIFGGKVTTIELRPDMQQRALANLAKAGLTSQVSCMLGDAMEVIPNELSHRHSEFDLIFIDAAKGQYGEFYNLCLPLLAKGGLLVADNVLYKGWVVPGSVFPRRKKTLVTRLRQLLQDLCNHPHFNSTLLPIGDGVLVCYYHKDEVPK